jgi:hypothetical protein
MQACPATHYAIGNAKLRAANAKTGATLWALGDEAVDHAAIRAKQGVSLT